MRKNLIVSAAASALLSSAALAADLPARVPAIAPAPVFTAVNWSGLYVGAQVGYGWGRQVWRDAPLSFNGDGVVGGLHAGYNIQSGALVFGVEADFELSGGRVEDVTTGFEAREQYRGSLRLRTGYAFDRALLYVTGGVAGRHSELSVQGVSASKTSYGWTLGAGLEYAINQNWSARAEYRYSDFGNTTYTIATNPIRTSSTDHVVRLGLTYRFGGAVGPVVAKY